MSGGRRDYDELQIRIERADDGYSVLALTPAGATGRGTFVCPLSDTALDDFVARVGLVRRSRSRDVTPDIKEIGAKLCGALLQDDVAGVFQAARITAREHDRGLRVTLVLSGAPELMRMPWELLYDRPRFLALSADTPVVRSLDRPTARRPRAVELPLRILGVVSAPSGYDNLDADQERDRLEQATSRLSADGLVSLEWLPEATLKALADRVAEPDDIHVLHFIGHGAYSEATEAGNLVLEDARGRAHDVSGHDLGTMLQDEHSLRLVVLNSCEGARTSHVDPFSGVATSLVEFDIPAVVGMQFEITDEAAIAFADALYRALAHGLPIDAAMGPARRAILAAGRRAEFGTPVLFLRGSDARLFDVLGQPRPERVDRDAGEGDRGRRRASSDARWVDALTAFVTRRWQEAAEGLEALGEDYPDDDEVQVRLAEARRQQELDVLSSEATEAEARGDWDRAFSLLEQLLVLDPTVDDAKARLERARIGRSKQSLLQDLRTLSAAEQWNAVLTVAEELAQLDPTLADPEGLATLARAKVEEEQLAERLSDALGHMDQHEWEAAVSVLEALSSESPKYRKRQVQSLLSEAREHVQAPREEPPDVELRQPDVRDKSRRHDPQHRRFDLTRRPPIPPRRERQVLSGHGRGLLDFVFGGEVIPGLAFAPDGLLLATGGVDKTVRIWEIVSGNLLHTLSDHTGEVSSVAFSPDGTLVASGSWDRTVRIWRTKSGDLLHTLSGNTALVEDVAFSPNGTLLAGSSTDHTVRVWDPRSATLLHTLSGGGGNVVFFADGRLLACGSGRVSQVHVWDTTSWDRLHTIAGVGNVAYSADGRVVAGGSTDGTVRVWDAKSGKSLHTLSGDAAGVLSVALSSDGRLVASGGFDRTVRIWRTKSGKLLHTLSGHSKPIDSVAFSPDGSLVASGSRDRTVRVWERRGFTCKPSLATQEG